MKPGWRFVLLAYFLLEVAFTFEVATWLGAGWTLLALILAIVAGSAILRRERLAIFSQLKSELAINQPIWAGLPNQLLRAIAGLLLISPGFVSDALALCLLVPGLRRWLVRRLSAAFGHPAAGPTIIDGEFRRVDDTTIPHASRESAPPYPARPEDQPRIFGTARAVPAPQ